jgi:hypothetical protein
LAVPALAVRRVPPALADDLRAGLAVAVFAAVADLAVAARLRGAAALARVDPPALRAAGFFAGDAPSAAPPAAIIRRTASVAALIIAAPILLALSAAASAAASAASCAWRALRLALSRTFLVGGERGRGGDQAGGEAGFAQPDSALARRRGARPREARRGSCRRSNDRRRRYRCRRIGCRKMTFSPSQNLLLFITRA